MIVTDKIHLIASTKKELLEYGAKVGLKPEWLQKSKHGGIVHFDIFGKVKERILSDRLVLIVSPHELVEKYHELKMWNKRMK
jgi:hypothetical protein